MNSQANSHHNILLLIFGFVVLVTLTCIAYSDISSHAILNWDDKSYISTRQIQNISLSNLVWMITSFELGNWHPLTWITYSINIHFWGHNPFAFKAINVIFHIFNSILVFFLTVELLSIAKSHSSQKSSLKHVSSNRLIIGGYFAALLFALHPLHVESVSWIAERKDVLCAFFFFSSLLAYLKYKKNIRNRFWWQLSLIAFVFSVMSKPMGVTLPVILMLIDLYPLAIVNSGSLTLVKLKQLFEDKFSFLIVSVLVTAITFITQSNGIHSIDSLSITSRIINASMSILLYINNFFFPIGLSPLYPFHPWSTDPSIFSFIPVVLVCLITIYFVFLWLREIKFPLAIWLFFIITLSPVIGLVAVGFQASADRYTYIPQVGFYVLSGGLIAILLAKTSGLRKYHHLSYIFLATITLAAGYLTYKQNSIWQNNLTLWTKAIKEYPGLSGKAYNNIATAYRDDGRFTEAIIAYNKALVNRPKDINIIEKIAGIYEIQNMDTHAISQYLRIIELFPRAARGYYLLGDHYYRKKNLFQAKKLYTKAFDMAPGAIATIQRSALVDMLNYDFNSAQSKLEMLLLMSPDDIGALQLAAKIHYHLRDYDKAKKYAFKVLELHPKDTFAIDIISSISIFDDETTK